MFLSEFESIKLMSELGKRIKYRKYMAVSTQYIVFCDSENLITKQIKNGTNQQYQPCMGEMNKVNTPKLKAKKSNNKF